MHLTSKNYILKIAPIMKGKAKASPLALARWTVSVTLLMALGCSLSSCFNQISVQERLVSLPKQAWKHAYQPWVHLDIEDSTQAYRIYAVIRHNQQFKYDNLLLRYGYIAPGDSAVFHEVNLPLAKAGKWLGDTLGSIVETRISLGRTPKRLPQGNNIFILGHLMADEPLVGILQVGIRIEAAQIAADGAVRASRVTEDPADSSKSTSTNMPASTSTSNSTRSAVGAVPDTVARQPRRTRTNLTPAK